MTTDKATHGIALAAATYPYWLDTLHGGAEFIVPFLGAAWLIVQIYFKIRNELRNK